VGLWPQGITDDAKGEKLRGPGCAAGLKILKGEKKRAKLAFCRAWRALN
jgi:hypothetical protein